MPVADLFLEVSGLYKKSVIALVYGILFFKIIVLPVPVRNTGLFICKFELHYSKSNIQHRWQKTYIDSSSTADFVA